MPRDFLRTLKSQRFVALKVCLPLFRICQLCDSKLFFGIARALNEKRAKIDFDLNGIYSGESMKYPAKSIGSQVSTVTLRSDPLSLFAYSSKKTTRRWSIHSTLSIDYQLLSGESLVLSNGERSV